MATGMDERYDRNERYDRYDGNDDRKHNRKWCLWQILWLKFYF